MTRKHLPEKPGLEPGIDGELIGRDPRKMSVAELTALGHHPRSPLAALRARCVDCCADFHSEVRKCVAVNCPAWPFRLGKNPYCKGRVLTEEQKARARINLERARNAKTPGHRPEKNSNSDAPGTHPPEKSYPQGNTGSTGGKS